ncbi:uncharacterized protein LOC121431773 [Lytechinus variegatus]|uniref:uncharacterized protein LOC121431773 n=1 Tax=Lytechinus variegatus TaxID=7654 RepID=UPI001BB27CCF|nr:uncharacterized protein LOC121431773 [Lytechinus variegatus]
MGNEAHCRRHSGGTGHVLMSTTLIIILSHATLTSTLASCNADSSVSLADRTQNAETVLAGTLLKLDGESTFIFKVLQVLKGDGGLFKKKIKIRVSDATGSRDASDTAPPKPSSTRAYPVAMTLPSPLSRRCLSEADLGERYIVFVRRVESSRRTFDLLFDGIPQTRKAIKAVKVAIVDDVTTTRPTTPIRVSSSISTQTIGGNEMTTSDNQQSTNAQDSGGEIGSTNTDYFPKTSDAHIEPCEPFYDGYCLHGGVCKWLTGIDKPSCDCISGYRGARCQYRSLATEGEERLFGDYWEVFIIGTIFGIVILLTLIGAIVYVVRKRKEAKTRRRAMEESADAFIQSNFQPGDDAERQQNQQQQTDNNQNKAADRYMRLPTNERYPIVETAVDSETLRSTTFGNSHPSSGSFRLQDPPFRKGSNHSTTSASRESTV